MTITAIPVTPARRAVLNRRGLLLAYATAGYNLLEGIIAVAAGAAASSAAQLGFGLDSMPTPDTLACLAPSRCRTESILIHTARAKNDAAIGLKASRSRASGRRERNCQITTSAEDTSMNVECLANGVSLDGSEALRVFAVDSDEFDAHPHPHPGWNV